MQEIDFSISLEESGIVVESSGTEGGVAKGKEALTLLDNPVSRNKFIDELMEVSTVYKLEILTCKNSNDCYGLLKSQQHCSIMRNSYGFLRLLFLFNFDKTNVSIFVIT